MGIKIDKDKINKLSPENALPLIIKIRRFIIGRKKPDGFTRLVFTLNIFCWFLLFFWNILSYVAILLSDVIKENKGFSVNEIIRNNGRQLGFEGQDFLEAISSYYFLNIFIWLFIFLGIALLYRKWKIYVLFHLGGLALHFVTMLFMIGLQYFIEDVSFFDKILYSIMVISALIHSTLLKKEKNKSSEVSADTHQN